jgi:YidC/Oxa1 family membrane protein insertase
MGWLMEPIYYAISWILLRWHWVWEHILPGGSFLGTNWDWVLAIVFLVITVRIILFPIFVKQIRSQRAMQALQPKMKELQTKYKGDQQTLREEVMKLYQTEKVNPLMGCLPLLLQIPVFFGLFHVLRGLNPAVTTTRELYGWTGAQWDSAVVARLFTAPLPAHFSMSATELAHLDASGVAVKIVAGILVLIMMVTTFMTSRQMILKTGWSQDPQQRMIQKLMLYGIPFSLLLSGWYFPIGVIIYWVTQNLFSLGQQFWVLHKYPPPVTAGNIPMKSTRSAAAPDSPGFLARFIQAKPAPPKPTGGSAPARGFLRRKPDELPPAPEARSLAPKPGARPVKQAPPPVVAADEPASSNGGTPDPKPKSTTDAGTTTTGAAPKATPPKAAPNGAAKSTTSAGSGAARGRSTTKKVGGTPRKGQPNRKGGAKR